MNYTVSQTEAIAAEKPDVLVSAAAGSGKTRVLTERVELLVRGSDLQQFRKDGTKTTEIENMQDIRQMLLVTFTRAAASEMRSRIVKALNKAADHETDPVAAEKLREQAEAAVAADITTFHGFCRRVISENYDAAGVAAGFAVLSESQAASLRNASVREVFDELYENKDEDARRLLARFGRGGDDSALLDLVIAIHAQMMGHAQPQVWLKTSLNDPENRLEQLYEFQDRQAEQLLREVIQIVTEMLAREMAGPLANKKTTRNDREFFEFLDGCEAAVKNGTAISDCGIPTPKKAVLGIARGEAGDMEPVAPLREAARRAFKGLLSLIYDRDPAVDLADIEEAQLDVRALVRIVKLFEERYSLRKADSNRLDFSDLEQKALKVLATRGAQYAARYKFVFVDEYQDTSPVQEAILQSIHRDSAGVPINSQFLVGDMKQSIYGFRFADPTIFEDKCRTYGIDPEMDTKLIRMNDNFRSSRAVIEGVNAIMGELMDVDLGDVPYTEDEQLVYGGPADAGNGVCEILIAQPESDSRATSEIKAAAEAEMIADRIQQLHDNGRDYGDIAVLFRSRNDRLFELIAALETRGIPAASPKGQATLYVELDVFLNLLRLTINDRQDVPLLSVMRSFLFNFDEKEFAYIASWGELAEDVAADRPRGSRPFFQQLEFFANEGDWVKVPEEQKDFHFNTYRKVKEFRDAIRRLRSAGTDMSVARFAEMAGDRFGFPTYLLTRPNGKGRRKLYEQLLAVIADLQNLHGNSLLRILDAVDELRQKGELFSIKDAGQIPGAVRLMTIHGAKGLEFPVVFLSGLDSSFNAAGRIGAVLRSDRYGITAQHVDPDRLERRDTIETTVVKEYLKRQQLSEELRLLYVAMTRAREELYMCGAVDDLDSSMNGWEMLRGRKHAGDSLLSWIMYAWIALEERHAAPAGLFRGCSPLRTAFSESRAVAEFNWKIFERSLRALPLSERRFGSLEPRNRIAAQQGVSQLTEHNADEKWQGGTVRPLIDEAPEITGALRGTLYHRLMQFAVSHRMDAADATKQLIERKLVTDEEAKALEADQERLQKFFDDALYARIRASSRVLIEQRFTLLVDAHELDKEVPEGLGKVHLRGMIDLAFREEDGWVLVDYKTDRTAETNKIVERYRDQIEHYSRALTDITKMPVKERYLYLLERGEAVPVN